jgi:50S ribosomal subunit-associated GTPase HflX
LVYDVADPESFEKLPEWLHTLKETAGDSIKSIMVIENKADQLPEKITGKEVRPPHFVNEERVKIFCRDNGLLFARTSAKMNALSFRWDGQKVSDVVNHLVLSIHATRLARGMSNFNLGAVPLEEHVVLKENPANGTMTPECSSCSTS